MLRRLGVLIGLVAIVGLSAGCYQGSQGLGAIGGCRPCETGCGGGSQIRSYARQWSRDAYHQQQFVDQYFLNYDVNDPYRCTCPVYNYCP